MHVFTFQRKQLFTVSDQGLNQTAEWDLGSGHQSTAHGVSFDDAQTLDTQLAFYFAIDQCFAEFIAIFQLDQFLV